MAEFIPKNVKNSLYLIKLLNSETLRVKLGRLILHLWREFFIGVQIIPHIQYYTIRIKKKDEILYETKTQDVGKVIFKIKEIMNKNTFTKEDIDE